MMQGFGGGGGDPKDADQGDYAEGELWVIVAEGQGDRVEDEGGKVLEFGGGVLFFDTADLTEVTADGEA